MNSFAHVWFLKLIKLILGNQDHPGEGRDAHNVMSKTRSDGKLRRQQGGQTENVLNKREFSTSQKIWKFTVVCPTSAKELNSGRSIDKPFRHHY